MHNSYAALQGSQPSHGFRPDHGIKEVMCAAAKLPVIYPTQQTLILLKFVGLSQRQSIQKSHIFRDIQHLLKLLILQCLQYKSKIYKYHRLKFKKSNKFGRKYFKIQIQIHIKIANTIIFVQFKSFYIQYCSISHSDHNKFIKTISEETCNV